MFYTLKIMLAIVKKIRLRTLLLIVTAVSLFVNVYLVFFNADIEQEELTDAHDENFFSEVETDVPHVIDDIIIGRKDTLSSILLGLGVEKEDVDRVTETINKVYALKKLKAGNRIVFDEVTKVHQGDKEKTTLNQFHILTDNSKILIKLNPEKANFEVKHIILPLENKVKLVVGKIHGSLFNSLKKSGADPKVVMDLINLFSYSTDFQRDLRSGDTFQILYEYQVNHEGKTMTKPKLIYSTIVTSNGQKEIFRHVMKSGKVEYFNAKGESMKRALLRTPINGARVSSGFGMRTHPVLGYSKMHQGLDYRAPTGTPILASGDGVVEFTKTQSYGYGRHVQIKHNGTYSTLYAHLSKLGNGIRPGAKVSQGQVIGYVGSTGMTTGPHLHYEVIQNGRKVNPNKVSFPRVPPLKGSELARFQVNMVKTEKLIAELTVQKNTAVAVRDTKNKAIN